MVNLGKIIVVGNGPIKKRRDLIESFDTIIRINTHGLSSDYRKDRGKRTDIWATRYIKFGDYFRLISHYKIQTTWVFHPTYGNIKYVEKLRAPYGGVPTTGYLCVMKALELTGKCDVVGFNFFTSKDSHYHEKGIRDQGAHNPADEKKILEADDNVKIHYELE